MQLSVKGITIAARDSLLSKAQVEEVKKALLALYPDLFFDEILTKTYGDCDLQTSLQEMGKTDFFTREVDALVLNGQADMAIHSAKDLPENLPDPLVLAAITRGVDPADSLVLREKDTLDSLPQGSQVGISCKRRQHSVEALRKDFVFKDIRGPVDLRLKLLEEGVYDAVVIAEAALIRLGKTDLNRIKLEGKTAPLQGRLALVVRKEDVELQTLLASLHAP